MKKIDDQLKREIYDAKMNGMRTKDILLKYGINKMMLSRIMKNGNGNIDSNVDKNSNVRDNMNSNINENGNVGEKGNINENSNMNSNVDELNEFRLGISNLFENIAELCNVVLTQQKRIDTLKQRVESLQTRLESQIDINHQTEEKTQPETKSDNVGSDVGWDEWEPTQIIHTNHGTEVIRDGKRYTRDEFLSQFTDEEIDLYKNLFIMDNNDDDNDDTKTATNEPQKQETHEKSKFDVDEDGFCALKTKKW